MSDCDVLGHKGGHRFLREPGRAHGVANLLPMSITASEPPTPGTVEAVDSYLPRLRGANRAAQRERKQENDSDGSDPPGCDLPVGEQRDAAQCADDARGDPPVVADDEVPPEAADGDDDLHASPPASPGTATAVPR